MFGSDNATVKSTLKLKVIMKIGLIHILNIQIENRIEDRKRGKHQFINRT